MQSRDISPEGYTSDVYSNEEVGGILAHLVAMRRQPLMLHGHVLMENRNGLIVDVSVSSAAGTVAFCLWLLFRRIVYK